MVEDLFQRLSSSTDYLSEPVDKFLKSYWAISQRINNDSTLASALATFGKDQCILKPAVMGRKRTINVQPQSLARRTVFKGGRRAQNGGRPRNCITEDHGYVTQRKRKAADPTSLPTWAAPPKKKRKTPHSLATCVEANCQLPK